MDLLNLADRSWPVLRRAMGGHTTIYRATNGIIGQRLPGLPPILLLDHVGARSGTRRTTPLAYVRDGDDVILVASKGGYPGIPPGFTTSRPTPTLRSRSARSAARFVRGSPIARSASASGRRS